MVVWIARRPRALNWFFPEGAARAKRRKIEERRKIKWYIELVVALLIPGWMLDPANQHGRIDPFDKPATPASGRPHEVMFYLFSSLC